MLDFKKLGFMKLKEKIQIAIQAELEPLGFRYYKSRSVFERNVDRDTTVGMLYDADCFHQGFTDITLYPRASYRDIEEVLYRLINKTVAEDGHFGFVCRLQWLMPEGESANWDFNFRESDNEEIYNKKLEKLLWRMRTYALPYIERLSHKDSAIEEAAVLDRKDLIFSEGVVPIMYCVWEHDPKAALEYLEEKRLRLLGRVKPEEWELLDRFKSGERFGEKNPLHAFAYDNFIDFANRFEKWVEEQM